MCAGNNCVTLRKTFFTESDMSDEKNEIKITPTQARKNVIEEWGEMEQLSLIAEMLGVDPEEYGLDDDELFRRYDEALDEANRKIPEYLPQDLGSYSDTLKEADPTAYDCGFGDFMSREGYYEIDSTSFDKRSLRNFKEAIADTLA